jgi:HAD superfamily hydrolase (TIGR01509 family)
MTLQAIIFDVDGTLAETEQVHREAFNLAFAEARLPWHWDQHLYARLLATTGGKERIFDYLRNVRREPSLGEDLTKRIAALHARKTEIYGELLARSRVTLRPGVRELIEAATRDRVRLAIATTTSRPNVEALLAATLGVGALGLFEVVAAADSVGPKKPRPDVFLNVLENLDLPASECLAIEDSRNGLSAALGAAIPTLVTRSTYTSGDDFSGAARVVDNLVDLFQPSCERDRRISPSPLELLRAVRALHAEATFDDADGGPHIASLFRMREPSRRLLH